MPEQRFPETTVTLDDERQNATIRLGSETLVVSADTLSNFIGHLGRVREAMLPAVPDRSPADRMFLQVGVPVLEVVASDDGSMVRLSFRTPGYGWLGFQFQREHAVKVGRHLVDTYSGSPAASAAPDIH